jgi:hypothetical protein
MIKIAKFFNALGAIASIIFITWFVFFDGNLGYRFGDTIIMALYFIYSIISVLYFTWLKKYPIAKYVISPLSVYVVFSIVYLIANKIL